MFLVLVPYPSMFGTTVNSSPRDRTEVQQPASTLLAAIKASAEATVRAYTGLYGLRG